MNQRLRGWFDDGRIEAAILGESGFFIPSVTFRSAHDRLLVLSELVEWMEVRRRESEGRSAIQGAVEKSLNRGDLQTALDVIWSLILVRESIGAEKGAGIDDFLIKVFRSVQSRMSGLEIDDELAALLVLVDKRLGRRSRKK